MNKEKQKNIFQKLSSAALFFCMLFIIFSPICNIAFATTGSNYSTALEDLKKDSAFVETDFVTDSEDYSISLIQIAESTGKELFVYTYQASAVEELKATSINISQSTNSELNYKNYDLKLLNSEGVFFKYKVLDFDFAIEDVRYYDISSIYRAFNEEYDQGTGNDNTISEVAFAVGKMYIVGTYEDELKYTVLETETIEITDKYVGFLRYNTQGQLEFLDSHFVAFSTKKDIDKLISADVYYTSQEVYSFTYGNTTYEAVEDNQSTLTYLDKVEVEAQWGFISSWSYSWDKISNMSDFLSSEDRSIFNDHGLYNLKIETAISDENFNHLSQYDWVLRFADTDYTKKYISSIGSYSHSYTTIADVSILRLQFESNGLTYNLGVIDNKQSGDDEPENETTIDFDFYWQNLMYIIIAIVALIILAPFLPSIVSFIWLIIKSILKVVWWIITLPLEIFK